MRTSCRLNANAVTTIAALTLAFTACGDGAEGGDRQAEEPANNTSANNTASNNAASNNAAVNNATANNAASNNTSANNTASNNAAASCEVPEATPLRRLSHFEYELTLAALYPNIELPAIELPADSRPHEFDNDAEALQPSGALLERYLEISRGVATALAESGELAAMAPCTPEDPEDMARVVECGEQFVRAEGKRIFRRPLTDEQVTTYAALFSEELPGATFADRQRYTIELMLAAPEFLYRFEAPQQEVAPGEAAPLDAWSLASRLSYFLWGTMPDAELFAAAEDGSLLDPQVLRAQAERMLADERAREVFLHFHEQWLDFERLDLVTKKQAEGFEGPLREAVHAQGMMFIERVLYEGGGSVADLLTSPRTFINAELAPIYGVEPPAEGWIERELEGRAGLLTQPIFLASHAHPDKPSPVLRGTFVLDRILCNGVGAPPPNAEAMGAAAEEGLSGPLTNRERYELTTNTEVACAACHYRINPPGYAFEHYDTMGRWREAEPNGLPIDPTGEFDDFAFSGPLDLAEQLAASPQVEACVTQKWLRYAWSGGPLERSTCLIEDLTGEVAGDGPASMRDIQLAIVTHPWFATFSAPTPEEE